MLDTLTYMALGIGYLFMVVGEFDTNNKKLYNGSSD